MTTLICLSHLRWDHVWQRPHHLMSRLAGRLPVIFVEEPMLLDLPPGSEPYLEERPGQPRLRVVRPILPGAQVEVPDYGYREMFLHVWQQLLASVEEDYLIWEYSPQMVYLTAAAHPQLIVYDCMDELANFRDAPSDIIARERRLLDLADLVFTGGRSMYEARKHLHARVHCFPSGVQVEHYRQALSPSTAEPDDVADLAQPRLGYFGVLDERLDWRLIDDVAVMRPDWQWVLVGPIAKVKPADLPLRPNIWYLGQRQYAALPAYLKSFTVATLPFARNEATQFISPTKTLEYMAGHVPIISTPIPDVVAAYQERVQLVEDAPAFVAAVEHALRETASERVSRIQAENAVLRTQTWDEIAARMWALVQEQLAVGRHLQPIAHP